jgi:hypothetical protein
MKLKQYIKKLKALEKEYGDLIVVYSIDDEGNDYQKVELDPTLMQVENIENRYLETTDEGVPVICVN